MREDYEKVAALCLNSTETDPVVLATQLMDLAGVPIHGPVHHFIVPAALLTCFNNLQGSKEQLALQLDEAAKRAEIVPGANCAMCGACGAGLGIGQFASIISGNSPLKTDLWSKVIDISSSCCAEIGRHGGPRCCKRDTYIALLTGVEKMQEVFGLNIPAKKPVCKYFNKNEQCKKSSCLFFPNKKVGK